MLAGASHPPPTIYDTLAADDDFDILERILLTVDDTSGSDYEGLLDDPTSSLTLLAPTDAAIVAFVQELGFEGTDEGAAFTYLGRRLHPPGIRQPDREVPRLRRLPHPADGAERGRDRRAVGPRHALGIGIGVDASGGGVTLVDGDGGAIDPTIVLPDIEASGGVIQGIDGVLRPYQVPHPGRGRVRHRHRQGRPDHHRGRQRLDLRQGGRRPDPCQRRQRQPPRPRRLGPALRRRGR